MQVHILGAGTPRPTPDRFGSAYVAQVGDERVMVDCGPAATAKLVKAGMHPGMVDTLFFTHHHYDHNVDYPCFVLNRWGHHDWGMLDPLRVYGPTYTESLTDRLFDADHGAWAPDWVPRTLHPASLALHQNMGGTLPRKPLRVDASDIVAGRVVETDTWRMVTAEAVHFQPYLDSLAYRLETDEGTVVFTGDTEPCQAVIDLARGADLMICMCWDLQSAMDGNGEGTGQCGTSGAARMAQEAGVARLVLTHLEPQMSDHARRQAGMEDVASIYDGEILFAEELTVVGVGPGTV